MKGRQLTADSLQSTAGRRQSERRLTLRLCSLRSSLRGSLRGSGQAGQADDPSRLRASKWRGKGKDNAETLRAQRFRREEGDAGRGWKATFTVYVTATLDNLSRYFLCSNDSNGVWMGRKWIRGMGMGGNLVRGNGVCAGPVAPSEESEVKSAV
jgi:hypothetical protein